ncbi:hypothetical protein HKD37_03G006796 [Glycine soja]
MIASCMRGNSSAGDLAPLDLKIEATCRRNNTERRRKTLQERTIQPSVERTCSSESSSVFTTYLRTHVPTKRSLLELSSQDALLAQNKLLAKQLESLTKTLSKLPTQLQAAQPSHSTIMQVGGCCIYGGAHESGCCIPQDEAAKEVNYMGNQNRQGFHSSRNFNQNQGQGWSSHPGNQFNKDQRGPSNRPPNQGPNLYERTTKLEETLAQFMQVSMSNHKSTESAIKNFEIQVGQLAKQIAENSPRSFGANTEKNPKEERKAIMTRSKREIIVEDESVRQVASDILRRGRVGLVRRRSEKLKEKKKMREIK